MTYDPKAASKDDLTSLEQTAATAAAAIAASDLAHQALAAAAKKAEDDALAADTRAGNAMRKANSADTKAANAMTAISNTPKVPWLAIKVVNVPALALGASTTLAVTWETPAPADDIAVAATVEGTGAVLGTLVVQVTAKSATGCSVLVKANALLTNSAAKINIVAGRSANQPTT